MGEGERTPVATLERAYELGRSAGLKFVYPGNVHGMVGNLESTHCPSCDAIVIDRRGFSVRNVRLQDGKCPECETPIPGVWG